MVHAGEEGFPPTALREINILLMLHHPHVIKTREMVVGDTYDKIFMVRGTRLGTAAAARYRCSQLTAHSSLLLLTAAADWLLTGSLTRCLLVPLHLSSGDGLHGA